MKSVLLRGGAMTSDSLNCFQNSRFPPFPYGIISQKNCLCSNSSLPVLSWTLSRKLLLSFHQNCIKVTGEFHVAKSKAYFSVLILFYLPAGFNTVSSSLFLEALYLVSAHCTPNFLSITMSTSPQLGPFLSHRLYDVRLSQGSVPWPLFCLYSLTLLEQVIFSCLYAFPCHTLMLPKFIWPAQSFLLNWACIFSCLLRLSTWRSDSHFNLKMSKFEQSHLTSSLIHFCVSVMLILFLQFRPKKLGIIQDSFPPPSAHAHTLFISWSYWSFFRIHPELSLLSWAQPGSFICPLLLRLFQ